jgi:hypothetical protein
MFVAVSNKNLIKQFAIGGMKFKTKSVVVQI